MKPTACVEILITNQKELIFNALISPEMISRWMFGPALREETIIHIKNEPKTGGSFSYLVERDGHLIDHVGVYRIIEPPQKLQFTWAIGETSPNDSLVTITLLNDSNSCQLQLTHEMPEEWADFVDRTQNAWARMLHQLKSLLESI
ncbi:MAG: hypothetical protein RJA81_1348 [Planctomycetota bacterium]|jgi:uncharacterized protein YndB with AHSA1/START domain